MKDEKHVNIPLTIKENEIKGEKIIFDIVIKEKLSHVIVIKDYENFHVNLDGEDIGYFTRHGEGSIERYSQHKGAHLDDEAYFKPIEDKLKEIWK